MSIDLDSDERGPAGDASAGWMASPVLLVLGTAFVLAGAAMLLGEGMLFHWIGYLCASVLAFTCLGVYRRAIVGLTITTGFVLPRAVDAYMVGLIVAGFAIAFWHAYQVARFLAG